MIELNTEELNAKIKTGEDFLVDFYSDYCGKCRQVAQWVEKKKDQINMPIYKINIDHRKKLQQKYNISMLPTIIAFKDGEVYKHQETKSTFAFMKEFMS